VGVEALMEDVRKQREGLRVGDERTEEDKRRRGRNEGRGVRKEERESVYVCRCEYMYIQYEDHSPTYIMSIPP
jgi:hypothetical protein